MPGLLLVEDVARTLLVLLDEERPLVVGRSADADVMVFAARASRRHVAFHPDGRGGVLVEDLDSTNGTLLDGRPLPPGPFPLPPGAQVAIGECRIVFRAAAPAA